VELYNHSSDTPSWNGDQLKKAQGQLYLYLLEDTNCGDLLKAIMKEIYIKHD
jgi:hypothetical protein